VRPARVAAERGAQAEENTLTPLGVPLQLGRVRRTCRAGRAILAKRGVESEMRKLLNEALKLPARERVAVAERLLQSVEAEGYREDDDAIQAAWAEEVRRRSQELHDGTVNGLSVEEARRIVASDPPDDQR
jgi:putative addiction module component (TIGR02574 family)